MIGKQADAGRRLERTHWFRTLGVALIAASLPATDGAIAAGKSAGAMTLASAVPMPRPSPLRGSQGGGAHHGDAIGALISGGSGAPPASAAPPIQQSAVPANAPLPVPKAVSASSVSALKRALDMLDKNDAPSAMLAAYGIGNPIDIKIVEWMIATGSYSGITPEQMAQLGAKLPDWPSQSLMRLRYEQAVARAKPTPEAVIRALGGRKPQSDDATLQLARAYAAVGRQTDAANLIRGFWRDSNFSEGIEKAILADFGGVLTTADHKWRMDRLIYAERETEALRAAQRLSKDQQTLAKAVLAVVRQKANAAKGLESVPAALRKDHIYVYARIQVLRRAGKVKDAAGLMVQASRDARMIVDPDTWWVERRLLSRMLVEAGDARTAYTLAANHSTETPAMRADAEFHAGWYALEFLRDPATAARHFTAIATISSTPISLSRAEYWLGRAAAFAGRQELATAHFQRAAVHSTSYYGQLAAARLGGSRLGISHPPAPNRAVVQHFQGRELVHAIQRLSAAGYNERAAVIYRHLAETLNDPAEIALLAAMAEGEGKHPVALQIGRLAAARGLPLQVLAFPTAAIPSSAKINGVEKPVVYAIARQESAFNPAAVSSAGARGLLQLMPATARETAKKAGLPYNQGRLTSDPAYNTTLGATFLAEMVNRFGGSYVMAFAAYNAGPSRVNDWVRRFGDPRDPRVDVVNWIEMIPFYETRNYVQRIMENLQVYRHRFGTPALTIEADLKRGASS